MSVCCMYIQDGRDDDDDHDHNGYHHPADSREEAKRTHLMHIVCP